MSSQCVYLFEHVNQASPTSGHTKIRSEAELVNAFYGFKVKRRAVYNLFNDHLVFLKLAK
jgi:hypothetical protein